jgi:hypothetical protein
MLVGSAPTTPGNRCRDLETKASTAAEKNHETERSLGLLGRKVGMMRIFTGWRRHPVTVLDVSNNRVPSQDRETDGYSALQVAFGRARPRASASPKPATSQGRRRSREIL